MNYKKNNVSHNIFVRLKQCHTLWVNVMTFLTTGVTQVKIHYACYVIVSIQMMRIFRMARPAGYRTPLHNANYVHVHSVIHAVLTLELG